MYCGAEAEEGVEGEGEEVEVEEGEEGEEEEVEAIVRRSVTIYSRWVRLVG